jgi:hypothetical protein
LFRTRLGAFCRSQADALARLCAAHRYQMNKVGRCLDVLPVLAQVSAADPRPLALVDLGTGAGLGLHLDRYRYSYDLADGASLVTGDPGSPVTLHCAVRSGRPPVPEGPITFSARVGVDTEPLDLTDPLTAAWLAACVPPEAGAVSRFAAASPRPWRGGIRRPRAPQALLTHTRPPTRRPAARCTSGLFDLGWIALTFISPPHPVRGCVQSLEAPPCAQSAGHEHHP